MVEPEEIEVKALKANIFLKNLKKVGRALKILF